MDKGPITDVWKPAGTPSFFILDPAGVIRYKWAGAPGAKALDEGLEKVMMEATEQTKTPR